MKHALLYLILTSLPVVTFCQTGLSLKSPDGNINLEFRAEGNLNWSLYYRGEPVLEKSGIGLTFSQEPDLGAGMVVTASQTTSTDVDWQPVYGVHRQIRNRYNELQVDLKESAYPERKLTLYFRAYNDGVAFRYNYPEQHELPPAIVEEKTSFRFTSDHQAWIADYGGYYTHQEGEFKLAKLSDLDQDSHAGLPLLVKVSDHCFAAITEADIDNWAGFYLGGSSSQTRGGISLYTRLSPPPGSEESSVKVKYEGENPSPWRVVMLGDSPAALVESEIIMNLNPPCALKDVSWIKPGKCAWDHWWSGEVQMDTETIKKYIKFASYMDFPYMLIDWQWYGDFNKPGSDITTVNPDVDMEEVLSYARENKVRCWLWLYWTDAEKQYREAFELYEKWGIAGVKIDFMASDYQDMVNWYHKMVKAAADHHLMINFHGAYKPDGFRRTYPNLMTREGVMGNEYSKWSTRITPEHDVTLAFTRMLAGPMDYTPGGFLNRTPSGFRIGSPAEVMNTRCHQLAMFVVYDSPVTTVCDNPDNYYGQKGLDFLKVVPVSWDDIRVPSGYPGEYVVVAKKSGDKWYVGVLNNSNERRISLKLDFLDSDSYSLKSWSDAPDAAVNAENLVISDRTVHKNDSIEIMMAPGGGYAAILSPAGKK